MKKIVLPDIQYLAVHFPIQLQATRTPSVLNLPPLSMVFPEALSIKVPRVKKGFIGLNFSEQILYAERLVGFENYDQMTVSEIANTQQLFPVKIIAQPAQMVNQLKILWRGNQSFQSKGQKLMQTIRIQHYRSFLLSNQLFLFQPSFSIQLRQIERIKFADDIFLKEALSGTNLDFGILTMDTRRRLLLRGLKINSKQQTVGVWIRNGCQIDILHLVLQYILNPFKRVQLVKGKLILFKIQTGCKPQSYLVQPLNSRWIYHSVQVMFNKQFEVKFGPSTCVNTRYLKFNDSTAECQQRTIKNCYQNNLKNSYDLCSQKRYQDKRYQNLITIIKHLQTQNQYLLQIILDNFQGQLPDLRQSMLPPKHKPFYSRQSQSFQDPQQYTKLARFSSYKQPQHQKQDSVRMQRSFHQFKSFQQAKGRTAKFSEKLNSKQSSHFPSQQRFQPRTRLIFDSNRKSSKRQGSMSGYQYTLSKKQNNSVKGLQQSLALQYSLKKSIHQVTLDLARQCQKQKANKKEIINPIDQFQMQSFQSKQYKNQIQQKQKIKIKQTRQQKNQLYFPPKQMPSVQSVSLNYDKISIGFLDSFRKQRQIDLPTRFKEQDSDSDSQVSRIAQNYNKYKF